MTLGFAMIVTAMSLPLMLAGFAAFGAGMGIVYYAALYYAMAVGRAEVDAGGTHEGLIGLGYSIGPLTGLISLALASAMSRSTGEGGDSAATRAANLANAAADQHRFNTLVVAIVWGLIALGAVGIVRTYLKARRNRRQVADNDQRSDGEFNRQSSI